MTDREKLEASDGRGMAGGSYVPTLPSARVWLSRLFRMEGYAHAQAEAASDHFLESLEALIDGVSDATPNARDSEIKRLREELAKHKAVTDALWLDCGDNSCLFAKSAGGMRTNGGCRCPERLFGDKSVIKHGAAITALKLLRLAPEPAPIYEEPTFHRYAHAPFAYPVEPRCVCGALWKDGRCLK